MATGDNTLTAISVAKECAILPNDGKEVYFGDIDLDGKPVWKLLAGEVKDEILRTESMRAESGGSASEV